MTTECFVLARAVHFAACLLFFGMFAFDCFVAVAARLPSNIISQWQARTRLLSLILLVVIFISGFAWFISVSMGMGGRFQPEILKTVWERTQFGTVWKFRLAVWLVAVVVAAFSGFFRSHAVLARILVWLEPVLGALLLGSLAWAGHGQETSNWHLFADVLHLLAAGFWPAGLLPFALLLHKLRRAAEPGQWLWVALLVRRFSAASLLVVSLLAVTGWVNSCFLVGSFSNLFQQPYGRWLLAKIILFCFAVVIGAVNLLRLKPRLSIASEAGPAAARLQLNVWLELWLGALIIVIVAILGILPPAIG
jgi:putative copper resistance protein D